jgi:hypothetical protein
MPFLDAFDVLPLLLLGLWILEEIQQILLHLGLVLFHHCQVIPPRHMHTGAPLLLCMHGIGTDDATFHERRVD